MHVFNEIPGLIDTLFAKKIQKKRIGLVPTMGALHQGHLQLVQVAKQVCDAVVCSIYVNPTQFNNLEDLKNYPRTLKSDLDVLEKNQCDIVFCPQDDIMYNSSDNLTLNFGEIESVMEGKFRAGHFNGVGLVVSKLLNIVKPDVALFGQKDLQQFVIIQKLVSDLMFDVELICVPIVREESGLAMSSRNKRLSSEGLIKATIFYNTLKYAKAKLKEGNTIECVNDMVHQKFDTAGVQLEYFCVVNKSTLTELTTVENINNTALCIAGYVEDVRLIDNMLLN